MTLGAEGVDSVGVCSANSLASEADDAQQAFASLAHAIQLGVPAAHKPHTAYPCKDASGPAEGSREDPRTPADVTVERAKIDPSLVPLSKHESLLVVVDLDKRVCAAIDGSEEMRDVTGRPLREGIHVHLGLVQLFLFLTGRPFPCLQRSGGQNVPQRPQQGRVKLVINSVPALAQNQLSSLSSRQRHCAPEGADISTYTFCRCGASPAVLWIPFTRIMQPGGSAASRCAWWRQHVSVK